jgi:hypothetical protein
MGTDMIEQTTWNQLDSFSSLDSKKLQQDWSRRRFAQHRPKGCLFTTALRDIRGFTSYESAFEALRTSSLLRWAV